MTERRFFVKNIFGGAIGLLFSSNWIASTFGKQAIPLTTEFMDLEKPFTVEIIYFFKSTALRVLMLPEIESLGPILDINQKYAVSGQLLSFSHEQFENRVTNTYVFNSERSYLNWETEMVLAKVINQKYCGNVVSQLENLSVLGEKGKGLNKRMIIEVKAHEHDSISPYLA